MWYGVFMFGGFWFWALIALFVIAEICCVCNESFAGASFFIIATSIVLFLFGELATPLKYLWGHPLETFGFFALYFVFGVMWSMFKFSRFVSERTKTYQEYKNDRLRHYSVTKVEDLPVETHERHDGSSSYTRDRRAEMKKTLEQCRKDCNPTRNKDKISVWTLYWVFSLLWDCIDTFTIRLAETLFEAVKSMYAKITGKYMAKLDADFKDVDDKERKPVKKDITQETYDLR